MDIHKPMELAPLFNLDAPERSTAIINGLFSGFHSWNDMAFSEFKTTYDTLVGNFWKPSDTNLLDDKKQWRTLDDRFVEPFKMANAMLAELDSLQTPIIINIMNYVTDTSFRMNTGVICQHEAIHTESYSYILSTFLATSAQRKAFEKARQNPHLKKRNHKTLETYNKFLKNPTPQNFFEACVSAIPLEGIFFYSGFAFFYFLGSRQMMMGTATLISYIQKDEMWHTYFLSQFIKILLMTVPELNTPENIQFMYDTITDAIELEKEWARELLKDIHEIDINEFDEYLEYLGNKRLRQLGLENRYEERENVMPWISVYSDEMIGNTKTDQFEQTPRTYMQVSQSNGFDEL